MAAHFQQFFTGPNLAKDIEISLVTFENYVKTLYTIQPEHDLNINKSKDAFFSLKHGKIPGYGEISFNVIKKCFGSVHKPLFHIFNKSLKNGFFPDELKIARVTPLFKKGSDSGLGNYRPIYYLVFQKFFRKLYTMVIRAWKV